MKLAPLVLLAAYPSLAQAAVVMQIPYTVDWLTYSEGASVFLGNDGEVAGSVSLNVAQGSLPPGALSAVDLDSSYWDSAVPLDSGAGAASAMSALRVNVFPGATSTVFSLSFSAAPANVHGAILALGGLDIGSTSAVRVSGSHSLFGPFASPIGYLGDAAWDPGFGGLDQSFVWNEGDRTVTASPNTGGGETKFIFLQLPKEGIDTVTLEFSSSSPGPFGDAFVVALGVVPEPGVPLLFLVAGTLAAGRRRRTC